MSEISLDEILLDSSNLPSFNTKRLEGRIELPLARKNLYAVGLIFVLMVIIFSAQLFKLQVIEGSEYALQSEQNRLSEELIVAERGIVYDRNGELVAWNERDTTGQYDFPVRAYTNRRGLGQIVGYVSYPQKDSKGIYYRTEYLGRSGIEEAFHSTLEGKNGERLVEETALGEIISEYIVRPPTAGGEFTTSIDAEFSEALYDILATSTEAREFRSGGAAIMDIHTGEVIAMTSFPSYDPEVLSDGDDVALIQSYNDDDRFPFLNKIIAGAYTPGSIVKPFIAYGALKENIIDPNKIIVSNGSITVPNPYNPDNPSVFNDWRAHGAMTMWDAIAYSSNVYFYTIGGGFGDQKGLGISKIDAYMALFGIGKKTGIDLGGEITGTVPSPEWKREVFDDDWRLGDTYHTAIGQFGFLSTPMQMLRAYAALANGGTLVTPTVMLGNQGGRQDLHLDDDKLRIIQEGMRRTVTQEGGTARPLERKDVDIAAKSGTAELGTTNARVNSWVAGYFPYESPRYAFILFMENGPRANTLSAGRVMSWVFDWIAEHRPELLSFDYLSP
jgi:penicillin-binding protein 2